MTLEHSPDNETTIPFAPTKAAFLKHEAAIRAIAPEQARDARVDVNALCVRVFTILPFLVEMRPQIEARLPDVDLAVYDSIEDRTHSLHYSNTVWQAKTTPKENVGTLAEGLEDHYEKALGAYDILILFELASDEPRKKLESTPGYSALTNNLSRVLGVLRGVTPEVLSQTPLKPRDLDQIEHDLLVFQTAWGQREFTLRTRDDAAILRSQAFTYLYIAYELARRAALYLYGYEEGNERVPSLFVSLGERSKRSAKSSDTTETATPPAANQPAGTGQGVSEQIAATGKRTADGKTNAVTAFVVTNPENLPVTSAPLDPTT